MTMFDLSEVRSFAADLNRRMDRCDNGEGMECATLDASLRHYAALCCEFREAVRQWGRAVFTGRVVFDPEVERVLRGEGQRLYARAMEMQDYGQKAEVPCYVLDGQAALGSAMLELYLLLQGWVSPKLAVGPSARQGFAEDPEVAEKVRQRVESLPPLPADYRPDDLLQQRLLRKLRKS